LARRINATIQHIYVHQQNVRALVPRNAHGIAPTFTLGYHFEFG
jgi:hypothetical protein